MFNNNLCIKNQLICLHCVKIKVLKRWVMRAGKKAHVVTEQKPVTRMFTRAQHTVHYSPEKTENKKNTEPLENWVSPTETRPVSGEIKAKLDKFPVKHPKIVVDADITDPDKTKHLNIAFTHAIPKESLQENYDFKVLAQAHLGKDPQQPTKDHNIIITDRVLTTTEVNTVPPHPELTAYLKALPGYPENLDKLIKIALKNLEDLEKKSKLTNSTVVEIQENTSTSTVDNLKKEQPLCFPLAQPKPLQIATTPPIALSPIKPLLPPVFLKEQRAITTREKIKNLAEKPLAIKSSSNSSASGAKNLTNKNNDSIEKHST